MRRTIQFESHTVELPTIYTWEHDPNVREYWDQPPAILLRYRSRDGRSIGVLHTADFFVLWQGSAGWVECKPEEQLRALAAKMPHRYVRGDDGRWRCPPGEAYAGQFGLCYHVCSSADIDWVYQRNLRFLDDYFRAHAEGATVDPETTTRINGALTAAPGVTLAELLDRADGFAADDVYRLIASEALHVDLHAAPLAEPDRVRVFCDRETATACAAMAAPKAAPRGGASRAVVVAPGAHVIWDGRGLTILNGGETVVTLSDDQQNLVDVPRETLEFLVRQGKISGLPAAPSSTLSIEARERLVRASPAEKAEANRRYACIAPCLRGLPPDDTTVPGRTRRQWLAQYRAAEAKFGHGYIGLLPRLHERGRRDRRLPQSVLDLITESIALDYETLRQRSKRVAYGLFLRRCEERGVLACSYRTFLAELRRRPRETQERRRKGERAAYQLRTFYWELTLTTPRHGDRPFEIAHLDHTELDIVLVHSGTHKLLGRPWVTFLVDAYSRRVLAFYLSYARPSTQACLMVLRFCVRTHARMPQTIVVDGGAEFRSRDFEAFLAFYGCTKKTRPGASPRHGSVLERLFGTTDSQFIHNLAGNTQLMKAVRVVTAAVDPKRHAVWTLAGLHNTLGVYVHEVYDTTDHPTLGQSPREAFALGMLRTGTRPLTLIPYDDDFIVQTLACPQKETAKVIPSRGVKIHYLYYWCDAFRDPEVEGTQVPVRYDPMDAGTAYAYVRSRWVQCISEYHARFHGRSEHEIRLASEELRRQQTVHRQRFTITTKKLADFLAAVDVPEAVAIARLRDGELRQVLQVTDGYLGQRPVGAPAQVEPTISEPQPAPGSGDHDPAQALDEPEERQLFKEYE